MTRAYIIFIKGLSGTRKKFYMSGDGYPENVYEILKHGKIPKYLEQVTKFDENYNVMVVYKYIVNIYGKKLKMRTYSYSDFELQKFKLEDSKTIELLKPVRFNFK